MYIKKNSLTLKIITIITEKINLYKKTFKNGEMMRKNQTNTMGR